MTQLQKDDLDRNLPLVFDDELEFELRSMYKGQYYREIVNDESGLVYYELRSTRFEYPSPLPVQIPIYLQRPESTDDRIRRLMAEDRAYNRWMQREEESDDDEFDFDDDELDPNVMPASKYEFIHEATDTIRRRERFRKYKEKRAKFDPTVASDPVPATTPAEPPKEPAPDKT